MSVERSYKEFGDVLPHIVYDLSILNMELRKSKAKRFNSALEVAAFLGCTPKKIFNNRTPGKRIFSVFLRREFAVRVDQQKQS